MVMPIKTPVPIRLQEDLSKSQEDLAATIKSLKASEKYSRDYADYLIALERSNDKDDAVLSDAEMRDILAVLIKD